jgi:putative tryptophan/tyrosine transport system substrate-binding protein
MNRRDFLLGSAAAAWPLAARAQQSRPIRLGFLGPPLNNPGSIPQYQAFRTQLEQLGFREGQNLTIEYRGLDDPRGPFASSSRRALPGRNFLSNH